MNQVVNVRYVVDKKSYSNTSLFRKKLREPTGIYLMGILSNISMNKGLDRQADIYRCQPDFILPLSDIEPIQIYYTLEKTFFNRGDWVYEEESNICYELTSGESADYISKQAGVIGGYHKAVRSSNSQCVGIFHELNRESLREYVEANNSGHPILRSVIDIPDTEIVSDLPLDTKEKRNPLRELQMLKAFRYTYRETPFNNPSSQIMKWYEDYTNPSPEQEVGTDEKTNISPNSRSAEQ